MAKLTNKKTHPVEQTETEDEILIEELEHEILQLKRTIICQANEIERLRTLLNKRTPNVSTRA